MPKLIGGVAPAGRLGRGERTVRHLNGSRERIIEADSRGGFVTHVSIGEGRGGSRQSGRGAWKKEASRVGWKPARALSPTCIYWEWGGPDGEPAGRCQVEKSTIWFEGRNLGENAPPKATRRALVWVTFKGAQSEAGLHGSWSQERKFWGWRWELSGVEGEGKLC